MTANPSNVSKEESAFSVGLSRDSAWTVAYDDAEGRVLFVFEPGDVKQVFLNPRPSTERKMVEEQLLDTPRFKLALERTKQFLSSCGYDVAIDE